jgi:hypothetical protein
MRQMYAHPGGDMTGTGKNTQTQCQQETTSFYLSNEREEKVENIWIENVIIVLHVLAKSLIAIGNW